MMIHASSEEESRNGKSNVMRQRAKYGIDAPRVVRAYIVFGVLLALPALIDLAWPGSSPIPRAVEYRRRLVCDDSACLGGRHAQVQPCGQDAGTRPPG